MPVLIEEHRHAGERCSRTTSQYQPILPATVQSDDYGSADRSIQVKERDTGIGFEIGSSTRGFDRRTLRSAIDIPFEFVGKVARTRAVAEASYIERSATARHVAVAREDGNKSLSKCNHFLV